jgi:hypothetical protein
MLKKKVDVRVDANTFSNRVVPLGLQGPPTVDIDISAALLMLGSITVPGGLTRASPARYWAWIRYFSAISAAPDLRIIGPFVDLDLHQKTILSDDSASPFARSGSSTS